MTWQEHQTKALADFARATARFEDEMREPVEKARAGMAEAGRQMDDLIARHYRKRERAA